MRSDVMLAYVPQFIQTARAYKAVIDAEGPEFDQLKTSLADILSQFYVETATWGLDFWEQMLNLQTVEGKPYDERRSRIISKLRGIGTVNVTLVKNVAESFVYGTVDVIDHPETYSFVIKFVDTRGIPINLVDVQAAIEEIKPAHLAVTYEFNYMTWDELDAENITWDALDALALSWDNFETGSWL